MKENMKSKNSLCGLTIAVVLHLGVLAGSAQTNKYLFSGSETNITLNPGTYIITAYGAPGGDGESYGGGGAEMSGEFNFSASTTLTLVVGGFGGGVYDGNGGGGGSFVVDGRTPLVIAGGGGGGGDNYYGGNGNGNISAKGSSGGSGSSPYSYGGPGGGVGGGGSGGFGGDAPQSWCYGCNPGGGGGGGFLGNGSGGSDGYTVGTNGGSSFDNGGNGGFGGIFDGGGFGGGGGGGGVDYSLGGGGGGGGYSGGGGGGSYSGGGGYGGGGGSIIGSSAITNITEVSGIASPDDSTNGEIIIIAVPTRLAITTDAAFGFTNGVFGFNVIGPAGSNVVIQASTDLQTWSPLQTNLLGSGPLHFSDAQAPANVQRFYRVQLLPQSLMLNPSPDHN